MNSGADATLVSCDGRSPYSIAMVEGHTAILEVLSAHLASNSSRQSDSAVSAHATVSASPPNTAAAYAAAVAQLCDAAFVGNILTFLYLLAQGVDVNGSDAEGFTPLHRAAAGGFSAIVEALLDHGADPNARDPVSVIICRIGGGGAACWH